MRERKIGLVLSLAIILALLAMAMPVVPVLAAVGTISISPASGPIGSSVSISGTGFTSGSTYTVAYDGTPVFSGTITAGGALAPTWFSVPTSTAGAHAITVTTTEPDTSNTVTFVVAPQITLSSSSVQVGDPITVYGSGFGAISTVTIYIDGSATTSTATDTSGSFGVSFAIPQGTGGYHTVTATDSFYNTASATYTITPSITVSPGQFTGGSQVTVGGTGFAASSTITLYIDDVPVSGVTDTTDTLGGFTTSSFVVPVLRGGNHTIQAKDSSNNSATLNFTVTSAITINPLSGPSGTSVQVSGNGFSAGKAISISFDGTGVVASPSTPTTDTGGNFTASFAVPTSSGGLHLVAVSDGTFSATASFEVTTSANLNPISGAVGTSVTVSGTSFASRGAILVTYDGNSVATATADINGEFSATFNIPASATGPHNVTITDGARIMSFSFSVLANVMVSPTGGNVGTPITVTGTGFVSGGGR